MRQRTTGLVALGAGVFFLVLAVLLRFYAVPSLEVVPKDYWTHYTATGTGTVFDTRDGTKKDGAALTQDITIKGNPSAAGKPSGSVVWDYASELAFKTEEACSKPGDAVQFTHNQCPVSFSNETVALDDHTAAVLKWSGDKVDTSPTQHGVPQTHDVGSFISKFPFDMKKQDYPLWDSVSGKAYPAKFVGTDTVNGLSVYKFVQTIPVGEPIYKETKLPPSFVGDIGAEGTPVPVYYSSTTTAWVEPVSGIPVKGDQKITLTAGSIVDLQDTNRLTLLDVTLKLDRVQATDSQDRPKFNADGTPVWTDYTEQAVRDAKAADRITLIKDTLPLISLILGLLLLLAGIFLTVRSNAADTGPGAPADPEAPRRPAHAGAAEEEESPTKVIPTVREDGN